MIEHLELDQKRLLQSQGTSSSRIYSRAMDALSQAEPHAPLLDIGCGQGEFLKQLSKKGFNRLAGCDGHLYQDLSRLGIQMTETDLNGNLPFADGSFQTITALEVIEHLENPRHLVREACRVLEPGGTLLVSTPNNESITSLLSLFFKGRFSAFADECYPAHITPVLRIDLERIFREVGLVEIHCFWTDQGRMPRTNRYWQETGLGLFSGRLFSDNYLVRGKKSH